VQIETQSGLFWEPEVKIKRETKRLPPDRFWEAPDFLPGLAEAQAWRPYRPTESELTYMAQARTPLSVDIEVYVNFFYVLFRSQDKKIIDFEMHDGHALDVQKLRWMLETFPTFGFNSNDFDLPLLALALNGANCQTLKEATNLIILQNLRGFEMLKHYGVRQDRTWNHVDLIEVAPQQASLKTYNGRLHGEKMQELPVAHDAQLSSEQMTIVRHYCYNDNDATWLLREALSDQLALRDRLSIDYGVDLRSKSDAQIAESVITQQIATYTGGRVEKARVAPGVSYRYIPPAWLGFKSKTMQDALAEVLQMQFTVSDTGEIKAPPELRGKVVSIGASQYAMGIGGLHSCEKSISHFATQGTFLSDRDVASYYPAIILNCGLYPEHLGVNFLTVYRTIVERRLAAKKRGEKSIADSLKITINGTFGKLGNPYSSMYAPNLLMQVTITGQLALLMLIERCEAAGFSVVSANTDGIVIKGREFGRALLDDVVKEWEKETGFETEESRYRSLHSRDVNNYIAIKEDGGIKSKGEYSNPWADPKLGLFRLHKNPATTVCVEALENFLVRGTPCAETIRTCGDIRKFVSVRKVTGGAVKGDVYLGKTVRWYYARGERGPIIYAKTGNDVPKSEGAKPLLELPSSLPDDIDYAWYERECRSMLGDLGLTLNNPSN